MSSDREATGGKRRVFWICAVVLSCLLVLEMATGCGRKKPLRPLNQDTAQVFFVEEHECIGG